MSSNVRSVVDCRRINRSSTSFPNDNLNAMIFLSSAAGHSRMVCNVHWHSDVIAGRAIAEAAVARLHTNETSLADLAAAKNELRAIRGSGPSAENYCAAEAEALGM
jgi:acid phosphatase (class A)